MRLISLILFSGLIAILLGASLSLSEQERIKTVKADMEYNLAQVEELKSMGHPAVKFDKTKYSQGRAYYLALEQELDGFIRTGNLDQARIKEIEQRISQDKFALDLAIKMLKMSKQ